MADDCYFTEIPDDGCKRQLDDFLPLGLLPAMERVAKGLVQLRCTLLAAGKSCSRSQVVALAASFIRSLMWEYNDLLPLEEQRRSKPRNASRRTADCLVALLKIYQPHDMSEEPGQSLISKLLAVVPEESDEVPTNDASPSSGKSDAAAVAELVTQGFGSLRSSVSVAGPPAGFEDLVRTYCGSEQLTVEQVEHLLQDSDNGASAVQAMHSAIVEADIAAFEAQSASLPGGSWAFVANGVISKPFPTQDAAFKASNLVTTAPRHPFGVQVVRCVGHPAAGHFSSYEDPLLTTILSTADAALRLPAGDVYRDTIARRSGGALPVVADVASTAAVPTEDGPGSPMFVTPVLHNMLQKPMHVHVIYDTGAAAGVFYNVAAAIVAVRGMPYRQDPRLPLPDNRHVMMHNPLSSDCDCDWQTNPLDHWLAVPARGQVDANNPDKTLFGSLPHAHLCRGKQPILVLGARMIRKWKLCMWYGTDKFHQFVPDSKADTIEKMLCDDAPAAAASSRSVVSALSAQDGARHAAVTITASSRLVDDLAGLFGSVPVSTAPPQHAAVTPVPDPFSPPPTHAAPAPSVRSSGPARAVDPFSLPVDNTAASSAYTGIGGPRMVVAAAGESSSLIDEDLASLFSGSEPASAVPMRPQHAEATLAPDPSEEATLAPDPSEDFLLPLLPTQSEGMLAAQELFQFEQFARQPERPPDTHVRLSTLPSLTAIQRAASAASAPVAIRQANPVGAPRVAMGATQVYQQPPGPPATARIEHFDPFA